MTTTTMNKFRRLPAEPQTLEGNKLAVDVRTPAEYAEAHIAGTLNVPLGDLQRWLPELKDRAAGRDVVLICRSGKRAETACTTLAEAGFERLCVLDGGVGRWLEQGHPIEQGRKAISLERQVRIVAGSLVALGTALGYFVHPVFLVIPAFVGCGLAFAGVTDTCGMALLLAQMPWNRGGSTVGCTLTRNQ